MSFAFNEGQCVDHKNGGMPSIVIGRQKSEMGREVYHVREVAGSERYRVMLGEFLVAA